MLVSWRARACLAVAMVLFTGRVSCLHQNLPARGSSRALYYPYRAKGTQLDSLVETFAQNDLSNGHMFDFDLTETLDPDTKPPFPSPPKFNINTFTFNEKNIRKPGDIFSLLADVKRVTATTEQPTKQKTESPKPTRKPQEPEIRIPGVEVINTFGKKILMATKDFQDLMATVQRMKKKVEDQLGNRTTPISFSSPFSTNTSSLVSLLLDSSSLEEIRTAGLTSKTEDEFLDHLTSVLIGEETRGTALTLDPVTIIALLTLAAYLMRAVWQVLSVTGRSLDVADLTVPLHLADLPEAMVNIHKWISSPDITVVREKRSVNDLVGNILDIPGNLAAVIKLYREGHRSCVQPFICNQIQRRSFADVTLTDMLISGLGYYFGESNWAGFIDTTLSGRSSDCDIVPVGCSPRTLNDAHYLENLYTRASYKFFNLLAMFTSLY